MSDDRSVCGVAAGARLDLVVRHPGGTLMAPRGEVYKHRPSLFTNRLFASVIN